METRPYADQPVPEEKIRAKARTTNGVGWGDIGCRFTPEMLELLEKALELRKEGIIKF